MELCSPLFADGKWESGNEKESGDLTHHRLLCKEQAGSLLGVFSTHHSNRLQSLVASFIYSYLSLKVHLKNIVSRGRCQWWPTTLNIRTWETLKISLALPAGRRTFTGLLKAFRESNFFIFSRPHKMWRSEVIYSRMKINTANTERTFYCWLQLCHLPFNKNWNIFMAGQKL